MDRALAAAALSGRLRPMTTVRISAEIGFGIASPANRASMAGFGEHGSCHQIENQRGTGSDCTEHARRGARWAGHRNGIPCNVDRMQRCWWTGHAAREAVCRRYRRPMIATPSGSRSAGCSVRDTREHRAERRKLPAVGLCAVESGARHAAYSGRMASRCCRKQRYGAR